MTKKTTSLSHHEALRYDYLSKNIHFLSEREKEELMYLHDKLGEVRGHHQVSSQHVEPLASSVETSVEAVSPPFEEQVPEEARGEQPFKMSVTPKKKNWLKLFLWSLLVLLLALLLMFVKGVWSIKSGQSQVEQTANQYFAGQSTSDGTNILILGSDKRPIDGDTDVRTDSILVLNIGNSSGHPKLVSFMRDTLISIDGVSDWGADSKLNSAFTIGQQEGNLGAETVRQVLKDNFDLDISYYVMVDFETFAVAIDTLFPKGVEIDAQFSTVDGEVVDRVEVPDDLGFASGGSLYQTIEAGLQRMDGKTLLNYARFRSDDSSDFGRTQRQQQVLSAIISQIKDPTKLFTGSEALGKVVALTSTNMTLPTMARYGLPVLLSGTSQIEQRTIPDQGDWLDDYDRYGGLGLSIDFDYYQNELSQLGLR